MLNKLTTPLRVLIVEDSQDDALLLVHELKRAGYSPQFERVETAADMKAALGKQDWDIILSDYKMPKFSGLNALALLKKQRVDTPVIIISGAIGEDLAVNSMKAGANDYVMKDNPSRLIPAIKRELTEAEVRQSNVLLEKAYRRNEIFKKTVLDSLLEGVTTINERGEILSFNTGAEKTFGYKEHEVLGENVRLLMPEPYGGEHDVYIQRYLQSGRTNIIGIAREVKGKRRDGSVFPLEISVTEMFFDKERIFIGTMRDITERKKMQDDLKHYTEELERSNEALQDFAFIASHDLQEPLRKVMSFSSRIDGLFGDLLGDRGKDYIRRMQKATTRMKQLIDGLLEYSRVGTKGRTFQPTNLETVISKVVSDLELETNQAKIQITLEHLPLIEADELQMYQLFQNLISNALKFHKKHDAPCVTIKNIQSNNAHVEITIEDNGIGFEKKYLPRIFKPFERLHGRSENIEGTGIGLAICQKIIDRHSGEITATSVPQKGSTFVVSLPEKHATPTSV